MGGDVIGDINYFTSTTDGCSPWFIAHSTPTMIRSNFLQTPIHVNIQDLRDREKSVNLDTHAFEVIQYNGSIQEDFEVGSKAQQTYYEEISDILKKRLGTSRVIIYHYTFRFRSSPLPDEQINNTHRNPAFYPHVDTDPCGVHRLVEKNLGKEEGEKAMKNRIQMINVWRPLGCNPITGNPLTICDYRSVDVDKDVHPLAIRGTDPHSTAYIMSHNAQGTHKWYYLSEMRSDEMFIVKMFDSKPDVAQFGFHTAFKNDNASTSNMEQKSLELRCLIFYDDKEY